MSVVFEWTAEDLRELPATCERDDCLPLFLKYAPAGGRVLESGCGTGRYVRYLHDRGWNISGLEYSAQTVAMTKKAWPDLDIVQGDCAAAPFPDQSFDAVISLGVVEHWLEGPQTPLKDMLRILKPGGITLITVPCLNTVRRAKKLLWWNEIFGLPKALLGMWIKGKKKPMSRLDRSYLFSVFPGYGEFFEYRMTTREFEGEVRKAGFEILEHCPIGGMDGIYHDLNPFGLLVDFRHWRFFPSRPARALNSFLSRWPFCHSHMQGIVARKSPVTK